MGMYGKKVSAIIASAGIGSRMGTELTKQRIVLGGISIIRRTALVFEGCTAVDEIVVAARGEEVDFMKEELKDISKLRTVVVGGKTRVESVKNAFFAVSHDTDIIAIHDGARCLITEEQITSVIDAAVKYGAATAVRTVFDTVKRVDGLGFIESTLSRDGLKFAATPQIFTYKLYSEALNKLSCTAEITDDNMLVEALGERVFTVDVGEENIKVTTPFDLDLAELILRKRGDIK